MRNPIALRPLTLAEQPALAARLGVDDLPISVCAVLIAEACNIGLEPLIQPDHPALTRNRLSWVQQNFIRTETLTRSNACLVDYQTTIPLAHCWGGGDVASADGLRFVTPVRTINAGSNPNGTDLSCLQIQK